MPIATTPKPPYYAAIFSSVRTQEDDEGYGAMGLKMLELVHKQPGFLGFEGGPGFNVFVSHWQSAENINAWRDEIEHEGARRQGRKTRYGAYKIRIAKVERDYGDRKSVV